jgi:hypothetical protein
MTKRNESKYSYATGRLHAAVTGLLAAFVASTSVAAPNDIDSLVARFGPRLLLVGPLTKISPPSHSAEIMGQQFKIKSGNKSLLEGTGLGNVVAVIGDVDASGSIEATDIENLEPSSVDGATTVLLSGVINSNNPMTGHATLGTTQLDYAQTLAGNPSPISNRQLVQIRGVSYRTNNLVVAHSTKLLSVPSSNTKASNGGSMGSGFSTLGGSMGSGLVNKGGSMGSGILSVTAKGGSMGSGLSTSGDSMGSGSPTITAKGGSMGSGRTSGGSMGSGVTALGGSMGSGITSRGGSMGSGLSNLGGSMGSGITQPVK